ncbi:hypothetical protein Taro_051165 [Colocasia esculenta]|uniref:Uncharacterized protein n=1 Tax=Colocasia esculenta TaxID=4460 RepID=A0A843XF94_COLES|nr:hypothetical protein [Colocasia esculenta]
MVGCSWETRVAVLGRVIAELLFYFLHLVLAELLLELLLNIYTEPVDRQASACQQDPHSRTQKTPLYVPVDSPIILLSTDSYMTSILSLEHSPCRQQASACRQVPTILEGRNFGICVWRDQPWRHFIFFEIVKQESCNTY